MEFKIPDRVQLMIDSWRAAAEILGSVDMDRFEYIHNGDEGIISAIDSISVELDQRADAAEQEYNELLKLTKELYDKKFGGDHC